MINRVSVTVGRERIRTLRTNAMDTEGNAEAVDVQTDAAGFDEETANMEECEEMMTRCNRRLAAVRSEWARLEAAARDAQAAELADRRQRVDVLSSLAQQNAQRVASIEAREREKRQLTAAVDARLAERERALELRLAQYAQSLDRANTEYLFQVGRCKAEAENNRKKAALMDSLSMSAALMTELEVGVSGPSGGSSGEAFKQRFVVGVYLVEFLGGLQ